MSRVRTTQVNYGVIDDCINVLNNNINDIYIQQNLSRLQMQMDYSVGDTADQLISTAQGVREAYQTVVDLMIASVAMLKTAKLLFKDCDETMSTELGV